MPGVPRLGMTWPEPGSGISANLAESLISIKVKNVQHSTFNVARPGLLAVGSICPNTKEEEKDQEEEDQRAKLQYVLEIKGSLKTIREFNTASIQQYKEVMK